MAFQSLKEMADAYLPMTDDFVVLRMYLSQPEIMDKGVTLLTSLLQREIKEHIRWKKKQMSDGLYDFSYYYNQFDVEIAARLTLMTHKFIMELPLTEVEYQWARENLKDVTVKLFYQPLYEDLKKHGVEFGNGKVKSDD